MSNQKELVNRRLVITGMLALAAGCQTTVPGARQQNRWNPTVFQWDGRIVRGALRPRVADIPRATRMSAHAQTTANLNQVTGNGYRLVSADDYAQSHDGAALFAEMTPQGPHHPVFHLGGYRGVVLAGNIGIYLDHQGKPVMVANCGNRIIDGGIVLQDHRSQIPTSYPRDEKRDDDEVIRPQPQPQPQGPNLGGSDGDVIQTPQPQPQGPNLGGSDG